MAIRMLFLYITYFSYRCFYSFSMNQKRIVLFTLFCLLKNKNNGNFTVSIHKVPIVVSLIVRIVNFRFRFKRGADFVYQSEGCGKPESNKRRNTPHLDRYGVWIRRMRSRHNLSKK